MSTQELIDKINALTSVDEVEKARIAKKLTDAEASGDDDAFLDVIDAVEALLDAKGEDVQRQVDEQFKAAGVNDDEQDPAYQAELKAMIDEVDAAQADLETELGAIENEANAIEDQGVKDLEEEGLRKAQEDLNQA